MRKLSADYIFTITGDPIKNGVIIMENDGAILDITVRDPAADPADVEYFEGIICPGFVNTHCHLELSHLKNKIPEKTGLISFIKHLQVLRQSPEEEALQTMAEADEQMYREGIVAVGDISNSDLSFEQKEKSSLYYHTFIELFGFSPTQAERLLTRGFDLKAKCPGSSSITPHAPYSVSEKLFKKIASVNEHIMSIHNQESPEENKFFIEQTGGFIDLYTHFGIDITHFAATGKTSLKSFLHLLADHTNTLLVHNTFTSREDILAAKEQDKNIYWCLCPNANLYIENELPDLNLFIEENCKMTIGTDSLASNRALSILDELKTIHRFYPQIHLGKLLQWATLNGAEFLGIASTFGSIEQGKKPGLVWVNNVQGQQLTGASEAMRII